MYKRHGDISIFKYTGKIKGDLIKHNGSIPIAFGSTTGHSHMLNVKNPKNLSVTKTESGYIFTLKTKGTLTHEEHKTLILEAGSYRSAHQIEKDWFALTVRQVID